jgi:ribosomal protein S18 acetylase RimI-like enzyme
MVEFRETARGVEAGQLEGFFVGWPSPPSPETHLRLLERSDHVVLAIASGKVVGFVTAVSDGVLSAYIPLLEVLPSYQGRGIGRELIRRMLARLQHLYMIDLACDAGLKSFYEPLGFREGTAMLKRNYASQSGLNAS